MKRLRIYISGPMSGKENYLNDFLQATQTIRSAGHIPVNPAALETVYPDADREEYLKFDLALLAACDAVCSPICSGCPSATMTAVRPARSLCA